MIPKKIREEMLASFQNDCRFYNTQVYGYIKPRKNGEFTMTAYAVNGTKRHGIRMTEVARCWSDRDYYLCKNIWKNIWGSTMIEFDERRNRPHESYGWYDGKWGSPIKWGGANDWFVKYIRYKNLDALANTKYRYCAYGQYRGTLAIAQYCALYAKYKAVEIMAKSGLSNFIDAKFLDRLDADKGLRDFFRCHAKELSWSDYGPQTVIRAHRNGWSLNEAEMREQAQYGLSRAPKGVDRMKLAKYLAENDIDKYDWYHYAEDVAKAKMDILGYGVAFPRDFRKAERDIARRIKRAQAREDRERTEAMKKLAARINAMLDRMKLRLAARVGTFSVVVPTTRYDFEAEGRAMKNCIGRYFDSCADGETMCFFVRQGSVRVADVEMNPKTGEVRQCRGKMNAATTKEVSDFAATVAKGIAKTMRTRKAA